MSEIDEILTNVDGVKGCFGLLREQLRDFYDQTWQTIFVLEKRIGELEEDLELLRSFLWDDVDETWPEDVVAVLQRAMKRLLGPEDEDDG